jgi:alpha-tubulin suppressor-like RCC1 family protein
MAVFALDRTTRSSHGPAAVYRYIVACAFLLSSCATPKGPAPAPPGLLEIRAGERHNCVVTSTGGVKCWGYNHDGQIGDRTREDRGTPVDLAELTLGIKTLSAGWRHTCAVTAEGRIQCWGNNHDGQLGDGSVIDRRKPQDVVGLMTTAKEVATGERHTCALTASGGVKCWGNNHDGQLGDGTRADRVTPVDVAALGQGVTAVAAGWRHTCALLATGGVKCWGNNHDGQIGDGTREDRLAPVNVTGLTSGVIAISARWRETCALTSVGGMKCWGANHDGQLGDGSRTDRAAPVDVVGLTRSVKAITVGWRHACALTTAAEVKCWGSNHDGQLGDGTAIDRLTPVTAVGAPAETIGVAAGGQHSCAMTAQSIVCWGENEDGQLGDGTFKSSLAAKGEPGF